jgi:tetratricopeptide (TPR) repeat protein
MTATDHAQAPVAPGRLGQAIPAEDLLKYLEALADWRSQRRQELDRIDAAALRASDADSYTSDLTLAMTIWQSISERLESLTRLWDSGRVGPQQREEMSRLIWGTGSGLGSGGGLGLTLVEACRLSDALTAALRARLGFDPVAADLAARVAATRASLQRSAEALAASRTARPATIPNVDVLRRQLEELAARAARGSDVTGPFAVLEASAARAERDLIVAAASHRDLGRDYRATLERRRELEAQEESLRTLVGRAVQAVTPVPKMAVPDVERLGRVPQTREALDAYRARLENVGRALAMATAAYGSALAELDELRGRLTAFAAKAASTGRAKDSVVVATYDLAYGVLWQVPCPILQARELVATYQRLLGSNPAGGSAS